MGNVEEEREWRGIHCGAPRLGLFLTVPSEFSSAWVADPMVVAPQKGGLCFLQFRYSWCRPDEDTLLPVSARGARGRGTGA